MTSSIPLPKVLLGGSSSGDSAGLDNQGLLEIDYQNLPCGALTTASSLEVGHKTAKVAANLASLEEITQFCDASSISVDVEASLTFTPTWPNGPSEGRNELVDRRPGSGHKQNHQLRGVSADVLALASELRKGAIERVLGISDLELGLQYFLRKQSSDRG
jgi:hypothetical protein